MLVNSKPLKVRYFLSAENIFITPEQFEELILVTFQYYSDNSYQFIEVHKNGKNNKNNKCNAC